MDLKAPVNYIYAAKTFASWVDAAYYPPRNSTTKGPAWDRSDLIWIRLAEVWEQDEITKQRRLVRPAITELGRCVWPKTPIAFHPMPNSNKDNPATTVEWGEADPFYEVRGSRVDATHWHSCSEPFPPGIEIPEVQSGAVNVVINNLVFSKGTTKEESNG